MAKLTAAARKRVPKVDFGIVNKKDPSKDEYPMEDRKHAGDAKARAKDALEAGHISQATYDHIVAMADKKLGETPKGAGH